MHSRNSRRGFNTGGFSLSSIALPINNLVASTGIIPNLQPGFPGERHFLSSWLGPGTNLEARAKRGDKPVDASDASAKIHDYDYRDIKNNYKSGKITKAQAESATRMADEKLQKNVRAGLRTDKSAINKLHASLADNGMAIKKIAEDTGLIDPLAYSGSGGKTKSKDPARRLKKTAKKLIGNGEIVSIRPRPPVFMPRPYPSIPILVKGKGKGEPTFELSNTTALKAVLNELPKDVLQKMVALHQKGQGISTKELSSLIY